MLAERTLKILEAAIQEFINTGEPVSSGQLYENYAFGIKPAMIRCELENLAHDGFLEHPYHSSGKIPSDKGYEFFAEQIIQEPSREPTAEDEMLWDLFEERAWNDLLQRMSPRLGVLGIIQENREVHKNGIENLVDRLEWDEEEDIKRIIRDFARIDERLPLMKRAVEETPEVFIGKNNPVIRSESVAIVAGAYQSGGNRVTLFAVGPKRMDYKKTVNVFKNLKRKKSKIKN